MKRKRMKTGEGNEIKKDGCNHPFFVARRGFGPLISRMKILRPNQLDERAIIFLSAAKVETFLLYQKKFQEKLLP